MNSNFADWRIQNPKAPFSEFNLKLEKFNKAGALFDMVKLRDVCKEYISKLTAQELYDLVLDWSKEYDKDIYSRLVNHREYCINILNIEREGEKIRKDIEKWSDISNQFEIFFDDMFINIKKEQLEIQKDIQKTILTDFLDTYYFGDNSYEWFNKVKRIAEKNGFSTDYKEYEKNPEKYHGKVGDVAMILRVVLTGKKQTPDLYQIMQVMGEDRVRGRIKEYINKL